VRDDGVREGLLVIAAELGSAARALLLVGHDVNRTRSSSPTDLRDGNLVAARFHEPQRHRRAIIRDGRCHVSAGGANH
jgi:hypothetical protein